MAEAEYPRWVYPPDGGPGCIVQTPDDRPKGWLDAPATPGPAQGERVIGQPEFPATDQTANQGDQSKLTPAEQVEVDTLESNIAAEEQSEKRKSKK